MPFQLNYYFVQIQSGQNASHVSIIVRIKTFVDDLKRVILNYKLLISTRSLYFTHGANDHHDHWQLARGHQIIRSYHRGLNQFKQIEVVKLIKTNLLS